MTMRWITRARPKIDRIACPWLIRRFIDPKARFRFVSPKRYRRAPGELRFDMFGGEFTHEGDRCTFEALIRRFGLQDPALRPLAELVHDIDLKDGRYGPGRDRRPGAAGDRHRHGPPQRRGQAGARLRRARRPVRAVPAEAGLIPAMTSRPPSRGVTKPTR
jgi:hypothetical protein